MSYFYLALSLILAAAAGVGFWMAMTPCAIGDLREESAI